MAINAEGIVALLKKHYDKAIVLIAFVGLLVSIVILTLAATRSRGQVAQYEGTLARLTPKHPVAEHVSLQPYSNAVASLDHPYRISTNGVSGFLVPERRVWCVKCRQPIPFEATVCTISSCQTPQPVAKELAPDYDGDGGGIPDEIEKKYNLNPGDSRDDKADSDGDKFTNLDEVNAGTDPLDPASHPDIDALLRVKNIEGQPLPLRFMGAIKLPDGRVRCQINIHGDSFFVSEGEPIGKTDFKLEKYVETKEMKPDPMAGGREREFITRKIVLSSGRRKLELPEGGNSVIENFTVTLVLPLDNLELKVAGDAPFKVREQTYRVISVDSKAFTVVIRNDSTGREVTVPRLQ